MHEDWFGNRNIEQRIGLRRYFRHATAAQQYEIGSLDARDKFWIGADANLTSIMWRSRIK
jgi:hypothetical protein